MVIFPLAPDQTIAQMWSNGARQVMDMIEQTEGMTMQADTKPQHHLSINVDWQVMVNQWQVASMTAGLHHTQTILEWDTDLDHDVVTVDSLLSLIHPTFHHIIVLLCQQLSTASSLPVINTVNSQFTHCSQAKTWTLSSLKTTVKCISWQTNSYWRQPVTMSEQRQTDSEWQTDQWGCESSARHTGLLVNDGLLHVALNALQHTALSPTLHTESVSWVRDDNIGQLSGNSMTDNNHNFQLTAAVQRSILLQRIDKEERTNNTRHSHTTVTSVMRQSARIAGARNCSSYQRHTNTQQKVNISHLSHNRNSHDWTDVKRAAYLVTSLFSCFIATISVTNLFVSSINILLPTDCFVWTPATC